MFFKNICVLVLWNKVVSASEGLSTISWLQLVLILIVVESMIVWIKYGHQFNLVVILKWNLLISFDSFISGEHFSLTKDLPAF